MPLQELEVEHTRSKMSVSDNRHMKNQTQEIIDLDKSLIHVIFG